MTVDRSVPTLDTFSELKYPQMIIDNGVTIEYLANPANKDNVKATVPTYSNVAAGHTLIGYWEPSAAGSLEATRVSLNHNQPETLTFTGDMIRERKDGQRFVTYRVVSRAG